VLGRGFVLGSGNMKWKVAGCGMEGEGSMWVENIGRVWGSG
jgi:hypothetical protein